MFSFSRPTTPNKLTVANPSVLTPDSSPERNKRSICSSVDMDNSNMKPPGTTTVVSSPSRSNSTKSVKRKSTLTQTLSSTLTSAAVQTAVRIKQSPIPDTLATLTSSTLTTYNRLDSAFNLQERIVGISQGLVKTGVVASGIAASALIKAGIAYQVTPSYKDLLQQKATQLPDTLPNGKAKSGADAGKGEGVEGLVEEGVRVRVMRVSTFPGSMPLPDLVETCVQTDPEITRMPSISSMSSEDLARLQRRSLDGAGLDNEVVIEEMELTPADLGIPVLSSASPPRPSPKSANASNSSKSPPKGSPKRTKSLASKVLNKTSIVASTLLTSSSNYVLGKRTTTRLIGVLTGDEDKMHYEEGQDSEPTHSLDTSLRKRKKLASSNDPHPPSTYTGPIRNLIVGGIIHVTTLQTLTRVPSSRLSKWFTPPAPTPQARQDLETEWSKSGILMLEDGSLFIDRDGTLFRYILNHLRGLPIPETLEDAGLLRSLRVEAVFYDLVGLVVEIDERLMELESLEEEEAEEWRRQEVEGGGSSEEGTPESMTTGSTPFSHETGTEGTSVSSRSGGSEFEEERMYVGGYQQHLFGSHPFAESSASSKGGTYDPLYEESNIKEKTSSSSNATPALHSILKPSATTSTAHRRYSTTSSTFSASSSYFFHQQQEKEQHQETYQQQQQQQQQHHQQQQQQRPSSRTSTVHSHTPTTASRISSRRKLRLAQRRKSDDFSGEYRRLYAESLQKERWRSLGFAIGSGAVWGAQVSGVLVLILVLQPKNTESMHLSRILLLRRFGASIVKASASGSATTLASPFATSGASAVLRSVPVEASLKTASSCFHSQLGSIVSRGFSSSAAHPDHTAKEASTETSAKTADESTTVTSTAESNPPTSRTRTEIVESLRKNIGSSHRVLRDMVALLNHEDTVAQQPKQPVAPAVEETEQQQQQTSDKKSLEPEKLTINEYHTVLRVLSKQDQSSFVRKQSESSEELASASFKLAQRVVQHMRASGRSPNEGTYRLLSTLHASYGDIQGMEDNLKLAHLSRRSLPKDETFLFNDTLIKAKAFAVKGDYPKSLELLKEAAGDNLGHPISMWNVLKDLLLRSQRSNDMKAFAGGLDIINQLEKSNFWDRKLPDGENFKVAEEVASRFVGTAVGRVKNADAGLFFFRWIPMSGLPTADSTLRLLDLFDATLRLLIYNNQYQRAFELWDSKIRKVGAEACMSGFIANTLLKGALKEKDLEGAKVVMSEFVKRFPPREPEYYLNNVNATVGWKWKKNVDVGGDEGAKEVRARAADLEPLEADDPRWCWFTFTKILVSLKYQKVDEDWKPLLQDMHVLSDGAWDAYCTMALIEHLCTLLKTDPRGERIFHLYTAHTTLFERRSPRQRLNFPLLKKAVSHLFSRSNIERATDIFKAHPPKVEIPNFFYGYFAAHHARKREWDLFEKWMNDAHANTKVLDTYALAVAFGTVGWPPSTANTLSEASSSSSSSADLLTSLESVESLPYPVPTLLEELRSSMIMSAQKLAAIKKTGSVKSLETDEGYYKEVLRHVPGSRKSFRSVLEFLGGGVKWVGLKRLMETTVWGEGVTVFNSGKTVLRGVKGESGEEGKEEKKVGEELVKEEKKVGDELVNEEKKTAETEEPKKVE
ncbi:hypothetical protein HDV05_007293 [Chytridiales sp. JEL 0842]|nr:hypothetical protein HDV05_007293 [Chytridiales sp. JEL 0842]